MNLIGETFFNYEKTELYCVIEKTVRPFNHGQWFTCEEVTTGYQMEWPRHWIEEAIEKS